jgi:hypothetical protein
MNGVSGKLLRHLAAVAAVVAITASVLASSAVDAKSNSGKVVTWAEAPATPPTYIFPLLSSPYSSTENLADFYTLMFLPLYWFGNNGEPVLPSSPPMTALLRSRSSTGDGATGNRSQHAMSCSG